MDIIVDRLSAEIQVGSQLRDFGSWMASEQRRIFLLCRRMLQDSEEADSATQDVFLKAYKALSKNKLEGNELEHPERWVTRIAVNTCLDRLRSKAWKIWQRRLAPADEAVIMQLTPGTDPDAEAQVFAKQIQQRLERAMAKLSERQRVVFTLRHFESMALEEIAGALSLDIGTVKAHLFRALGKMREDLRDLYTARGEGTSQNRPICASSE